MVKKQEETVLHEFKECSIDEANTLSVSDWVFDKIENGVYYFHRRVKK